MNFNKEEIKKIIKENDEKKKKKTEIKIASKKQRFINYILDFLFFSFAYAVLVGTLILTGIAPIITDKYTGYFGLVVFFIYYFLQEATTGRTLAKAITGTYVVTTEGEKVGWGRAAWRTVLRIFPFEAFSYLGNGSPRGWHDKWSKTVVISYR